MADVIRPSNELDGPRNYVHKQMHAQLMEQKNAEIERLRAALHWIAYGDTNDIHAEAIAQQALKEVTAHETGACGCPEVCKVCGGRAKACALLGHRPEADRSVKWHECKANAQKAVDQRAIDANALADAHRMYEAEHDHPFSESEPE